VTCSIANGNSGFGIINLNLTEALIKHSEYEQAHWLYNGGGIIGMSVINDQSDYNNKTFRCILDFNEGYFKILYEDAIIAEIKKSFQGETLLIYGYHNSKYNKLTLSILLSSLYAIEA